MQPEAFRIVYCSRSATGKFIDRPEVAELLDTSRRNNKVVDVTGALLVNGHFFVQVLEGSFDAVQSVFERIQADPRHDDIVVLQAENVSRRLFTEWSMAHAEPEDPTHVRAILSNATVDHGAAASSLVNLLSHVVHHVPA